jgi:uncharacterized protein YhaN
MRLDSALKPVTSPVKGGKLVRKEEVKVKAPCVCDATPPLMQVSIKDEHQRLLLEAAKHEEASKQLQERFQRLQAQASVVQGRAEADRPVGERLITVPIVSCSAQTS